MYFLVTNYYYLLQYTAPQLAAAQCIVIGPVCGFVCLCVLGPVNITTMRASIFTKLGS